MFWSFILKELELFVFMYARSDNGKLLNFWSLINICWAGSRNDQFEFTRNVFSTDLESLKVVMSNTRMKQERYSTVFKEIHDFRPIRMFEFLQSFIKFGRIILFF